jgi:hypothetical protein
MTAFLITGLFCLILIGALWFIQPHDDDDDWSGWS